MLLLRALFIHGAAAADVCGDHALSSHGTNASQAQLCCHSKLKERARHGLLQEFIRIGYYVNNDYVDEELREHPPQPAKIDK